MKSLEQKIKDLTWFDSISKLKDIFTEIKKSLIKIPNLLNKPSNTTILTISPDGTFAKTEKSDFLAGIGGGATPTLNQVITAGNTATVGSNSVELLRNEDFGFKSNIFTLIDGNASGIIKQEVSNIELTANNTTVNGNRQSKLTLNSGTGVSLRREWQGFATTLNFTQPTSSYTLSIPTGKTGNQTLATLSDIPTILNANSTLDFPSTSASSSSNLPISVPGAVLGDLVTIGSPVPPDGCTFTAFVSASDVVTVRLTNSSGVPVDPDSAVFKVRVFK